MSAPDARPRRWLSPTILAGAAVVIFMLWFWRGSVNSLAMRVPGTDRSPGSEAVGSGSNPVLAGKVIPGEGKPANLPGSWPQFRGTNFDGISREAQPLARQWAAGEPRELWGIDVGEGYAGAAVSQGRVYLMDYDREKRQDALRCLSFADGKEIWRYSYPVAVKRNHGMSRTVPAVSGDLVVAMGPKCHVVCLDATNGQLKWGKDLVRQFGTTVPPWYAGQCPFFDNGAVILAPAGKTNLVIAVEAATGNVIWQSPNPHGWKMTHSSVVPMEFAGERMYLYCADKGVAGVSARDGRILWDTTAWKISIATVPSPLVLPGGKVFFSGGYNAGSLMVQLKKNGDRFEVEPVFRLGPEVFGATQQTPILYQEHIYGVRPDGRFTCLDLSGKSLWASPSGQTFGLGPFMVAGDLILAMNDSGSLRLIEASATRFNLLAQAQVLKGRESWGPMALAGGRLLVRDLTRLVCLDVAAR